MYLVNIINCFCIINAVNTLVYQNLGGKWALENFQKGYYLSAQVPGGIYSDLMNNSIIGDVFYGFNDVDTRWVSKLNWTYSRKFIVNESLFNHEVINLVLDGIDTFSNILINNVEIGETENMFVQYIFNIKPHLRVGYNLIEIKFKSAVQVALDEYEQQSKNYVVLPKCVPKKYNGECHVNHIRKMQASFSWDWGPALPSMGIWKNIYLEAYNSTVMRYITVDINSNVENDCWDVVVYTYFSRNSQNSAIYGKLIIKLFTETVTITNIQKKIVVENINGDFVAVSNLTVPKSYVHEWWPNGYGNAYLYNLKVAYINPNKTELTGKSIKIGFRTVELVQSVINSGREFYFKVNAVPIFAKGSNVIPINILPELGQNEEKIRFLLQSAKDVHMNMVRVWGGGVYESDTFYKMADELGILIWQDFMFACSMYPSKDTFLRNVQSEVRHQVLRLQYHPSIAIWAGNNENEVALQQNWYNTTHMFSQYKKDYIKLYVRTIKSELLLYDTTRSYLTSSPTNGIQSEIDDYIAVNPQSTLYGDVHFYNILVDGWQTTVYPITRFTSEYGYQALPSIATLLTATNNTYDLRLNGSFLKSRQHHPAGYVPILLLIDYQLNLPAEDSPHFLNTLVYYSQIIQAMSVKIETEYYRIWRSDFNNIGEGFTMGALYWQLNDVWVAPTWSSIDYNNKWKMLHYFAKNFLAPVIITGNLTVDKALNIYVVSDLIQVIHNASITISVFKWDSFIPVKKESLQLDILPGASQKIKMDDPNMFLSNEMDGLCGADMTQCFMYLTLTDGEKSIAPDNYIFPVALKTAIIATPKAQVLNVRQTDETKKLFEITIGTNVITLFVWMDTGDIRGCFSENGFIQVTPNKTIQFLSEQQTTMDELSNSLIITYLFNSN